MHRVARWWALAAAMVTFASLSLVGLSVAVPAATAPAGAATTAPVETDSAYGIVDAAGGIMTFGGAGYYGDTLALHLAQPVVGAAADPKGGYWMVASDGGIFTFGGAQYYGSTGAIRLNKPIVGMAATSNGNGYWLVATDGGIFDYGNAGFFGSTGSLTLNEPIVGMAPTPDGGGYWLVASDAGVFTFGDAVFSGSAQSPEHPPLYPPELSAPIAPVVAIINDVTGPQAAHQGGLRVAFSGDSLSLYEGYYVADSIPPYWVDDGAEAGCGYTNGAPMIPWGHPPSDVFLSQPACALWYEQLQWTAARFHPDVTVIQTGYWEAQDRLFDGTYSTLADADYSAYIESNLEQAVQIAHSDGGAVIISTSPYFDDGTPNDLVDAYNRIVESVAAQDPAYVSIDDVYSVLDPDSQFATTVDGIAARSADGVHITQAAVDNLIEPALNQQIANVAGAVYAGSS